MRLRQNEKNPSALDGNFHSRQAAADAVSKMPYTHVAEKIKIQSISDEQTTDSRKAKNVEDSSLESKILEPSTHYNSFGTISPTLEIHE